MKSYMDLPEEMIVDIISRLRAKSVGLCRCVSKSWRALLSQPEFIRTHLHRSRNLRRESLILLCYLRGRLFSAALSNANHLFDEITLSPTRISFADHPDSWSYIHASCDGLLFVWDRKGKKFVLNPVTREIREVPCSPFGLNSNVTFRRYGFGYDSVSDDYKIVTISQYYTEMDAYEPGCTEMFVNVYSLKAGSWKSVESPPYDYAVSNESRGVLVNGCFHWLAYKTTDYEIAIVAFHFVEEKFHEVPPPSSAEGHSSVYNRLGLLGGCLCMIDEEGDDIWVMKGYGIQESWTKFTINDHDCWFLCFLGQDQVVMLKAMKHVMYNLKQGTWKDIVIDGNLGRSYVKASFLESLVSPHGSNDTGRE